MFLARFYFDGRIKGERIKRIAWSMAMIWKILVIVISVAIMALGIYLLVMGSWWGVLVMFLACIPELLLFSGMVPVSVIRLYAVGELIDRVSALEDGLIAKQSDSD